MSSLPDAHVLATMTEVARSLSAPIDLDQTLGRITAGVVESVPGVDRASVSVTTRDGEIQTLAPTDQIALDADILQYKLKQGPCLEAALSEPVVVVDDIASDPRWPVYGPKVAALGIGSQVAFQFRAAPHLRGALNLYSVQRSAIGSEARVLCAMFASLTAAAMGWCREEETLQEALRSRETIGQAVGIIMERYTLTPDQAFGFLVRTSQTGNIKLHQVAQGIINDVIARTP